MFVACNRSQSITLASLYPEIRDTKIARVARHAAEVLCASEPRRTLMNRSNERKRCRLFAFRRVWWRALPRPFLPPRSFPKPSVLLPVLSPWRDLLTRCVRARTEICCALGVTDMSARKYYPTHFTHNTLYARMAYEEYIYGLNERSRSLLCGSHPVKSLPGTGQKRQCEEYHIMAELPYTRRALQSIILLTI